MLQVSPAASAAVDLVQPFLGAGDQIPEECSERASAPLAG